MPLNLTGLAGDLLAAAKGIIPMIVPGAGPLIKVAEHILAAGARVKEDLTAPYEDLDETLDELHARVNATVDAVRGRLRGDG